MIANPTYERRPNFLPMLAFLALVGLGILLYTVSEHSKFNHVGETWDSMSVLQVLEDVNLNPNNKNKLCPVEFIIASCPHATCRDATSCRFGQAAPQAKIYCGQNADGGLYGVFGLNMSGNGTKYITGYYITRNRWESLVKRDGCFTVEFKFYQVLFR